MMPSTGMASKLSVRPRSGAGSHRDSTNVALMLEGLDKSYGETHALVEVDLEAVAGEVHAIVGENGSGKSTLVKLIGGVIRADRGKIAVNGGTIERPTPARMAAAGVAVIFQEVLTVGSASVVDNVFLGYDGLFRRRMRPEAKIHWCAELLERLSGRPIDPRAPVESLPLSSRQWITVARALVRRPAILLLDESTAALDLGDAARLLAEIELLKRGGTCVLLVTHRLAELQRIADRALVLRDGAVAGALSKNEMVEQRLVELMTGQSHNAMHPQIKRQSQGRAEVALRFRDLALTSSSTPVSNEVHRGEIVGLAGLDGEGQVAFLQAAAGIAAPYAGRVEVIRDDAPCAVSRHRDAAKLGIAYIPGDRKAEGLLQHASILENFSLPNYSRATRLGLISRRAMRSLMKRYTAPLKLRAGRATDEITSLSGGNQQKVIIARWLAQNPTILLLNDPTRGVDIVTKRDLYASLIELAEGGAAVLFLSSEIEELTSICHRIVVFRGHTVYAELDAAAEAHDVVAAMFGVERIADIDLAVTEAATGVSHDLKDIL